MIVYLNAHMRELFERREVKTYKENALVCSQSRFEEIIRVV